MKVFQCRVRGKFLAPGHSCSFSPVSRDWWHRSVSEITWQPPTNTLYELFSECKIIGFPLTLRKATLLQESARTEMWRCSHDDSSPALARLVRRRGTVRAIRLSGTWCPSHGVRPAPQPWRRLAFVCHHSSVARATRWCGTSWEHTDPGAVWEEQLSEPARFDCRTKGSTGSE